MKTRGLDRTLTSKQHSRVTLTFNFDVSDKLFNGQIQREIPHFKRNISVEIAVIYSIMDDDTVGKNN